MDNGAFQIEAFEGPGVCQTFGGIGEQEKANADLLAASPELYESLEEFANSLTGAASLRYETVSKMMERAHAALAKARGEVR